MASHGQIYPLQDMSSSRQIGLTTKPNLRPRTLWGTFGRRQNKHNISPQPSKAATAVHNSTSTKQNGFLALPAELRNVIYEQVLQDESDALIREHGIHEELRRNKQGRFYVHKIYHGQVHFLLHVCRQIRDEIEPMYWSTVTLKSDAENLVESAATLTDVAKRYIKTVFILAPGTYLPSEQEARIEMREYRRTLRWMGFCSPGAVVQMTVTQWLNESKTWVIEESLYKQRS